MTTISESARQAIGAIHGSDEAVADQRATAFFSLPTRARSARNISLWMSYLPDDSVQSMIAMGWDHST